MRLPAPAPPLAMSRRLALRWWPAGARPPLPGQGRWWPAGAAPPKPKAFTTHRDHAYNGNNTYGLYTAITKQTAATSLGPALEGHSLDANDRSNADALYTAKTKHTDATNPGPTLKDHSFDANDKNAANGDAYTYSSSRQGYRLLYRDKGKTTGQTYTHDSNGKTKSSQTACNLDCDAESKNHALNPETHRQHAIGHQSENESQDCLHQEGDHGESQEEDADEESEDDAGPQDCYLQPGTLDAVFDFLTEGWTTPEQLVKGLKGEGYDQESIRKAVLVWEQTGLLRRDKDNRTKLDLPDHPDLADAGD